jgi:putative redox protein
MKSAVARRRRGYQHEVEIREHRLIVDEPEDEGGTDSGPGPTELLAASLATCTAITLEMYAKRKEWDLGDVEVAVDYRAATQDEGAKFTVKISLPASLEDDQLDRLLVIAHKCPVHRALLAHNVEIDDSLELIEA